MLWEDTGELICKCLGRCSLRSCETYNPATRQWTYAPNMTHARKALCGVATPSGIIALGGYDGQRYLNSVEKLDITHGEWQALAPMQAPRCSFAALMSSDCSRIVVIGGYSGEAIAGVEAYEVALGRWSRLTPLPEPRYMHCSILISD
jgi:hypothetical protein